MPGRDWAVEGLVRNPRRLDAIVKELALYYEAIAAGAPIPTSPTPPWQPTDLEKRELLLSKGIDCNGVPTEDYVRELRKFARLEKQRVAWFLGHSTRIIQSAISRARKELDIASSAAAAARSTTLPGAMEEH
ncbi:hypothetical protein V492_00095 [Pseudogymnoascus sp. VKM F-4246]|nr:hypothetical protein V492_00095 [Pseudogymnoascus sp. VKM F-4246]